MVDSDDQGKLLAESIDWSEFGAISQTNRCRCGPEFRSHHKMHRTGDTFVGVTKDPCPKCGSHVNVNRSSSDPESFTLRR